MSLINQMLTDLERRRSGAGPDDSLLRLARATHGRLARSWSVGFVAAIGGGFLLVVLALSYLGERGRPLPPSGELLRLAAEPAPATAVVRSAAVVRETPVAFPPAGAESPAASLPAVEDLPPQVPANAQVQALAPEVSESKPSVPSERPRSAPIAVAEPGPEKATSSLSRVVRAPAPEAEAETALQAGRTFLARGHLAAAEERLRRALQLAPGHLAARETLALLLQQTGRGGEAEALLEQGLSHAPGHLPFLKGVARLRAARGDWEEARNLLRQAPAPAPAVDPEFHALLAATCQQLGDWSAAALLYRQLLTVNAGQGTWWVGLGIALEGEGEPAEAARSYRRALEAGGLSAELAGYARGRLEAGI